VGITLPQAGQQATRENVVRMAENAKKEGFDYGFLKDFFGL
jgi:hypothetical protein